MAESHLICDEFQLEARSCNLSAVPPSKCLQKYKVSDKYVQKRTTTLNYLMFSFILAGSEDQNQEKYLLLVIQLVKHSKKLKPSTRFVLWNLNKTEKKVVKL